MNFHKHLRWPRFDDISFANVEVCVCSSLVRTKPVQFTLEIFNVYFMEDILASPRRLGMHFLETKDEDDELKPGHELRI